MDADLMEALYRRYYAGAVLYCTSLCGDEQLAQDIVADAFVKAYLSLPEDIPSFRYWLLRVCKNLWFDHLRRQRKLAPEEAMEGLSDGVTPESAYIQGEQSRCLWSAINALPPTDRELLILHYFSDVPMQEAARLLGIRYSAARQRMARLRRTLKQKMEEQGYER